MPRARRRSLARQRRKSAAFTRLQQRWLALMGRITTGMKISPRWKGLLAV